MHVQQACPSLLVQPRVDGCASHSCCGPFSLQIIGDVDSSEYFPAPGADAAAAQSRVLAVEDGTAALQPPLSGAPTRAYHSTDGNQSPSHQHFDNVLTPELRTQYTRLFQLIDAAAQAASLPYVLAFRSLLSYGRSRDFTPWETEQSIMIPVASVQEQVAFLALLAQQGVAHVRGYQNAACATVVDERIRCAGSHENASLSWVPLRLWLRDGVGESLTANVSQARVNVFYYAFVDNRIMVYDELRIVSVPLHPGSSLQRVQYGPVNVTVLDRVTTQKALAAMYGGDWCVLCQAVKAAAKSGLSHRPGVPLDTRNCAELYPPGSLACASDNGTAFQEAGNAKQAARPLAPLQWPSARPSPPASRDADESFFKVPLGGSEKFKSVWTPHLTTQYIQLFRAIDAAATAVSLPYAIAFGSLLGYSRSRGFTPWDDDHDIMIPATAADQQLAFLKHLEAAGVDYVRGTHTHACSAVVDPRIACVTTKDKQLTWVPVKMWLRNDSVPYNGDRLKHKYPYVDMFYYHVAGTELRVYDHSQTLVVQLKSPLKLRRVQFGPVTTQVFPDDVNVDLLSQAYGGSWCTTCVSNKFNHAHETKIRAKSTRPCSELFAPGMLNCITGALPPPTSA